MSARKYVPNRLRGVLGGDPQDNPSRRSSSSSSSSLRAKGRKSRPWRVDAASWKQQLQERKTVYDHFALPEKADEEPKEKDASGERAPPPASPDEQRHTQTQTQTQRPEAPKVQRAQSVPARIADAGEGGDAETLATPKRGEQVETVPKGRSRSLAQLSLVPSASTSASTSPAEKSNDPDGATALGDDHSEGLKSAHSGSSASSQPRKPSPLPRHRQSVHEKAASPNGKRKGKRLSPAKAPRPSDVEYDIDFTDLVASGSGSRDSNSNSHSHSHSNGDAAAVHKSAVMEAVEDFIDPSQADAAPARTKHAPPLRKTKSSSRLVAAAEEKGRTRARTPDAAGAHEREIYTGVGERDEQGPAGSPSSPRTSPVRRGGRRRPRPSAAAEGSIMGDSSSQGNNRNSSSSNKNNNNKNETNSSGSSGDYDTDDEWSIRPVPSDEEECLEKRRWPLRMDADSASTESGDTDIVSVINDVVLPLATPRGRKSQTQRGLAHGAENDRDDAENEKESEESESSMENIKMRERIALSLSQPGDHDDSNGSGYSEGAESTSNAGDYDSGDSSASPDPLQRARKTLLLSSFNRSIRSLQDSLSSRSRREDDRGVEGDHGARTKSARSIFVPLRSRQGKSPRARASQEQSARDIPLNLLNDHGVYVSQYNETGIFVPPKNDSDEPDAETSPDASVYNELGVFVPPPSKAPEEETNESKADGTSGSEQSDETTEPGDDPPPGNRGTASSSLDSSLDSSSDSSSDADGSNAAEKESKDPAASGTAGTECAPGGTAGADRADPSASASPEKEDSPDTEAGTAKDLPQDDGTGGVSSLAGNVHSNHPADADVDVDVDVDTGLEPNGQQPTATHSDTEVSPATPGPALHESREKDSEDDGGGGGGDGPRDDGIVANEVETKRKQLALDLEERVGLIYTGNHLCIETIGTSEDPDPLATKRALMKAEPRESKQNIELKAQLNDTVSSMNTDHHHVVESPGKLKSKKGKKWKSRLLLKKAGKGKNSKVPRDDTKAEDGPIASLPFRATEDPLRETTSYDDDDEDAAPASDREQLAEASGSWPTDPPIAVGLAEESTEQASDNEPTSDNEPPREGDTTEDSQVTETEQESGAESVDSNIPGAPMDRNKTEGTGANTPAAEESKDGGDTEESKAMGAEEGQVPESTESGSSYLPTAETSVEDAVDKASESGDGDTEHASANRDNGINNGAEGTPNERKDLDENSFRKDPEITDDATQENCLRTENDSKETTLAEAISANDQSTPDAESKPIQSAEELYAELMNSNSDPLVDGGDAIGSFAIDDDEHGQINEMPPPDNSDNNDSIIQGMPPNKGKKWKDRLKKKKNKKSSKVGAAKNDTNKAQEMVIDSPSSSVGTNSVNSENLSGRPSFNRDISDLTEENSHGVPQSNEEQNDVNEKAGKQKSNKWKNRLKKMKTSKQDSSRSLQEDAKSKESDGTSNTEETPADSNHLGVSVPEPLKPIPEPSDSNKDDTAAQEADVSTPVDEIAGPPDSKLSDESPHPAAEKTNTPSQAAATPDQNESSIKGTEIQRDLRKSFNVFDAFLREDPIDGKQIDDGSIYTELTIGQESMLQSGLPGTQVPYEEEEQSYMDFTVEESLQPSYVDETVVSEIAPKDHMMSPFMSNLLSSRLFQDMNTSMPLNVPQQKVEQENSRFQQDSAIDSPEANTTKKFPTITVGIHDDEMTQITMGSLEDDDVSGNQDDADEPFFDAVASPVSRTPSEKSSNKKSGLSTNSRRSESGISVGSQTSCPESSKQRIAEMLRKQVWSSDTNTVARALEELEVEARKGFNFRAQIVRCGGVMTIMKVMEMNSNCENISILCCSILENLALEPQTQIAVCEMEGISLIVRSMQDHAHNAKLQESACAALATICRQQEANTLKDPMKDAEGAVPILLSCMTRYPNNSIIQSKAFGAIASLCTGTHSHDRLTELSKAGGIMTLTTALQTPWDNKNDQHEAISYLSILLRGIAELNDNKFSLPTADETSKYMKHDGTSHTSNETESMSTRKDDSNETRGNETAAEKPTYESNGEETTNDDDDDDMLERSVFEEIPDLPIMASSNSSHVEDIPDLGDIPTMVSNLECQNDDPYGLNLVNRTADQLDVSQHGSQNGNEEQCIVQ